MASAFQRNGKWYASYKGVDGWRKKAMGRDKAGAERIASALQEAAMMRREGLIDLSADALTFASNVRIDIDGTPAATISAGDACPALLSQYGNANHAFTYQLPPLTPGRHTIKLYALDAATDTPVFIGAKTVTAHHLTWTLHPPTFVAGQTPTFTLAIKDASNHSVSNYSSTLTLSIFSGPSGGTLTGTVSAPVINGIATFNAFTLTKAGTYTPSAPPTTPSPSTLAASPSPLTPPPLTSSSSPEPVPKYPSAKPVGHHAGGGQ